MQILRGCTKEDVITLVENCFYQESTYQAIGGLPEDWTRIQQIVSGYKTRILEALEDKLVD